MDPLLIAARSTAEFDLAKHLTYVSRRLLVSKKDIVYLIDGEEGSGKSTLGRLMGRKLGELTGAGFSVKPVSPQGDGGNIVYPGQCHKCVIVGLHFLPPGSWVQVDEALGTMHSRASMRREQVQLMQFFAMVRIEEKAYGIIGGNFRWFDPFMRDHRGKYRVKTYEWQQLDKEGKLWDRNGKARFWKARKPDFGKVIYWKKEADFAFQDDNDPSVPEYVYYKKCFTLAFALGYEFDWHAQPYEPGLEAPKKPEDLALVDPGKDAEDIEEPTGKAPSMPEDTEDEEETRNDRLT